jgi:hypothetical protein
MVVTGTVVEDWAHAMYGTLTVSGTHTIRGTVTSVQDCTGIVMGTSCAT